MKKIIIIASLILACASARAQEILWEKLLGAASGEQRGVDVIPIADGGFIAVAQSRAGGGADSLERVYLVRTDGDGGVLWEKTLPGDDSIVASALYPAEGAFYLIGSIHARDIFPVDTAWHPWIAKLDLQGEILWQRRGDHGRVNGAERTADGGFIATGELDSSALLEKIDAEGNFIWRRKFQYGIWSSGTSVRQTSDGGYVIAGVTINLSGVDADPLIIRAGSSGDSLWAGAYMLRFVSWEEACCVEEVAGGLVMTGMARLSGDASDRFGWLTMTGLDDRGNLRWTDMFPLPTSGGDSIGINHPYMSRRLNDGSVVIAGATGPDNTVPFLLDVGSDGTIAWQKMLGELQFSQSAATAFRPLPDGGFIVAGVKQRHLLLMRLASPTSGVEHAPEMPSKMDLSFGRSAEP